MTTPDCTNGRLLIVATPIGNLSDISQRAVDALNSADAIACEDTRHTRKLLNHIGCNTATFAVHEHNELQGAAAIIERLRKGETVALVSDAGMPGVSDPGAQVVDRVANAGFSVSVIPGPSAFVAALAVCGFDTQRFVFEGFLSTKASERLRGLQRIAQETAVSVVYEAPHRLVRLAEELAEHCGQTRRVCLVRELTKLHEEIWRGTTIEFVRHLGDNVKGECVVVVEGAPPVDIDDHSIVEALERALAAGLTKKAASEEVSEKLHVPKNRVYSIALSLK